MSVNKKANFRYDSENDVLYITLGPPRPSYCAAEIDDVFIMKDVETQEYCGVTILDFAQRLKDGTIFGVKLPFSVDFREISKELTN